MVFLKPIDEELLKKVAEKFKYVITVEDGVMKGGLGSAVLEYFAENGFYDQRVFRVAIDDNFVTHGSIKSCNRLPALMKMASSR